MPVQPFEDALTDEGWTQQEMDELQAMLKEAVALVSVHKQAKAAFAAAVSRWNGGVSAKVATLGAGFEIPNPTDLAGTGPITKENLLNNIMSYVSTIQSLGSQGHLDNILPLVGSVNI